MHEHARVPDRTAKRPGAVLRWLPTAHYRKCAQLGALGDYFDRDVANWRANRHAAWLIRENANADARMATPLDLR